MYSLLGQFGFGLFRVKSQYLGLMDMPKLFIVRLPSLAILTIKGDSSFANVFHL